MQLMYIVACLVAYLMHVGAVSQTQGSSPIDKRSPKYYALEEMITEWKAKKCIFPDDSWYTTNLIGFQGKLKHCQNLETYPDHTNPDKTFQRTLCQNLYVMSLQLCTNGFQLFIESCLNHAELTSLFNKDNNVCSFVYKQDSNKNLNFMRDATLCNNTCGDSADFKELCELYAAIFYQYQHSNKCMPQKASSTTAAPTGTESDIEHVKLSDNGAATTKFIEASKPSKEGETNVPTTVSKSPEPTLTAKENITSSSKSDEQFAQNKSPTPSKNQALSISLFGVPKEKPMDEAKTTPVLIESTPPITDTNPEDTEESATPTTTTILPSTSVQLTSAPKQIIESSSKNTPESDEVIDPDTPATTATTKKNADETQNNGNFSKGHNGDKGIDDIEEKDNTDNEGVDSKEPIDGEEQISWLKNDESEGGNQNKKPTKENVNKEDDDLLHGENNKQKIQPQHRVKEDEDESPGSGHFLAYFLTAVVICISGYVIYHNKQKILAFVIEGRNSSRAGRQRSKDVKYTQLKSNVEEVLPSLEQSATSKNFVY